MKPCVWKHDIICAYQHDVSPYNANCLEDSSASLVAYLFLVVPHSLCLKVTNLISASITIGGVANSAQMILCGMRPWL